MKKIFGKYLLLSTIIIAGIGACKSDLGELVPPATRAEFPLASGSYSILNTPTSNFKIPVGFTNVSNTDRTINFTVTSPTGAAAGQQYTLTQNGSIVIPAGKSLDSIEVKGLFSGYATRTLKDTLVFTITGGDGIPFEGFKTYKLVMQKVCPLVISDYSGPFTVVTDAWEDNRPGDVINLTAIDATHFSFKLPAALNATPIVVTVNPANNALSIPKQTIGSAWDYGDPKYTNPFVSATGSIVPCDKKINLTMTYGYNTNTFNGTYALVLVKK